MIEKSYRKKREIFEMKTSLVCSLLFVTYSILIPCTNARVIPARFLAGENTPVWIVKSSDKPFEKLESKVLKKIDDENPEILEKSNLVTSVSDVTLQSKLQKFYDSAFTTGSRTIKSNRRMKTIVSSEDSEFVYPTIVIVMDYHYKMKSELREPEAFANYAIEFWNNVNARLSAIEKPRISIRIGGIVIAIRKDSNERSFSYEFRGMPDSGKIREMGIQWRHQLLTDSGEARIDFPKDQYDIVAHMTDDYSDSTTSSTDSTTDADPNVCDHLLGKRFIMILEKSIFDGLESALCALRVLFGDKTLKETPVTCMRRRKVPDFSEESKRNIEETLKNMECLSSPYEYYPAGSPLPSWHLPGQHYSRVKQCEARGAILTTQQTGCEQLVCQGSESDYGQPLDGTPCFMDENKNNEEGTCWNGVCQAA